MSVDFLPGGFLLEHRSGYRLGREEQIIRSVAESHGLAVQIAALSQIRRGKVVPGRGMAVIGSIDFVKAALGVLGRQLPAPDPYPLALRPYLHRSVHKQPMKKALERIECGHEILFIKPANRWKSFTGCVPADGCDVRMNGVSRNQDVWVSSPVRFLCEWRAYVHKGRVLGLSWYDGARDLRPDEEVVKRAVATYVAHGAPVGFAIDFGVLEGGETALVEVNDGFAIGFYGDIPPVAYASLLASRWHQLLADERPQQQPQG